MNLKSLQKEWYEKLKQEGFIDIENSEGNGLRKYESKYFKAEYSPQEYRSKEEYFYQTNKFLCEYDFQTETDKEIWLLHSDGISIRGIALIVKLHFEVVRDTLKRLKKKMMYD